MESIRFELDEKHVDTEYEKQDERQATAVWVSEISNFYVLRTTVGEHMPKHKLWENYNHEIAKAIETWI